MTLRCTSTLVVLVLKESMTAMCILKCGVKKIGKKTDRGVDS